MPLLTGRPLTSFEVTCAFWLKGGGKIAPAAQFYRPHTLIMMICHAEHSAQQKLEASPNKLQDIDY